jgi:beta-lactamase regulating signal transducer with metallopeptidase domain
MNYLTTLCLVLMAAYGLAGALLSICAAFVWRAWFERKSLTSRGILMLRLFPCAAALFITLVVVLPAFVINEPRHAAEPVRPLLLLMAAFTLAKFAAAFVRAGRSWMDTASLLRQQVKKNCLIAGQQVEIIDMPQAMVAVVGVWRPRIVAASQVLAACSGEEFREVIGHEAAHLSAHDNLKLLLLIASPDILTWMTAGDAMLARWRAAVEFEADEMATGPDRRKRVALASALIKVARLSVVKPPVAALSMPIAVDDIDGRVRRLLVPMPAALRAAPVKIIFAYALLLAVVAVPLYGRVQELIEALVAFGR